MNAMFLLPSVGQALVEIVAEGAEDCH